MYSKTRGRTTMKGEWFEVKTAALLYLRSINWKLEFHLGTNIEQARNFDDIVLQYRTKDPESQWHTCFIQLKHKERARLDTTMFISNDRGGFSLQKYLKSFCDIKNKIRTDSDHHLFKGPFDTCYFVIYTNAPMVTELAVRPRNTTAGPVKDLLKTSQQEEVIVEFTEEADEDIYRALEVSGGPEATEFLRKLMVFAGQPSEDKMDTLIKDELRMTCSDHMSEVDVLYRFVIEAVRQWWSEDDVHFLTHDSRLLEKALDQYRVFRISSQEKILYRLDVRFTEASLKSIERAFSLIHSVYFFHYSDVSVELGCTKVMQVLRQVKGSYTFVSLHRLSCMRGVILQGWMEGEQPYLVIYCNTPSDHEDLWVNVTSLLIKHMCKHVVLVFNSECFPSSFRSILMRNKVSYYEVHEGCQLLDLDEESIEKIKGSKLILQGKTITLRSFLGDNLENAGDIIIKQIEKFLVSMEPAIGKYVPTFSGPLPKCYLERSDCLKPQILTVEMATGVIALSNSTPARLWKLPVTQSRGPGGTPKRHWVVYLQGRSADDEIEFERLCGLHETVHWVSFNNEDEIKWIKSKGDIRTIYFFRDMSTTTKYHPNTTVDLQDKVVILIQPKRGREPSLAHFLCMETKNSFPHYWVLYIPLHKMIPSLEGTLLQTCDPIEFLVDATGMSRRYTLQMDLFTFSVNHGENVIVVLDGFEEIPVKCQEAVKDLILKMMDTGILQIVMSLPENMTLVLERTFATLAYEQK